jgi:hypothetical protein
MNFVNLENAKTALVDFNHKKPFPFAVIDNFFNVDFAHTLANEFPKFESDAYNGNYFNKIEIKKAGNIWDKFPPATYKVFFYLNGNDFISFIEKEISNTQLYPDNGLHGGGWHTHPPGGLLNVHLDYSIHPKLGLQRKYNLIVYLNPNYKKGWVGELGLWDSKDGKPTELVHTVEPLFNRAIIFETTNGWHGLEIPNKFPEGNNRNSIAVYYLIDPEMNTNIRNRALFVPSKEQENDEEIIELIKRRSTVTGYDPELWSRK